MNKSHYTYILKLPETGEFYIGVRSCIGKPEDDVNYKGSMCAWAIDKSKLTKEIISIYDSREIANIAEHFMIYLQRIINKNILCKNAHTGNRFSTLGNKEVAAKISKSKKGIKCPESAKLKLREFKGEKNAMFGKSHTDESKELMRNKAMNRLCTDETKKKIGEGGIGKHTGKARQCGKNNPMYGKSFYDIWVIKYGKDIADIKLEEYKNKCRKRLNSNARKD